MSYTTATGPGLFIAFEGGEGSGKTTQARMLAEALYQHGIETHLTREPGDTLLGKYLRGILLKNNAGAITTKAQALLFAADRAEHVATVIEPKLDEGVVVICDRYSASTMAYQHYAGGLNGDAVKFMSDWASDGLYPDITFLLDVDPMIGLERAKTTGEGDHYEEKQLDFHNKVRQGFLSEQNDSWIRLEGNVTEAELHDKIFDHVLHVLRVLQRFRGGITPGAGVLTFSGFSSDPLRLIEDDETDTLAKLRHCPECGIRLLSMFKSLTEFICPNNHGWMTVYHGDEVWHPPTTAPKSADEICKKKDCDNPNHLYGHARIEDLSDFAFESGKLSDANREAVQALKSHLAAKKVVIPTACGNEGCIAHPAAAPKVEEVIG